MKNGAHTELLQHLGHEIKASHRDTAREHEHVVGLEVKSQPLAQLLAVVLDVIVGYALKAALAQRTHDGVGV